MKNLFNRSLIGLAIILCASACGGKKSPGSTDSAKTSADSASTTDTLKHSDTTLKVDTVKKGTDTSDMKTDTVSKKISSETEIKKKSVKKAKQQ